MSLVQIKDWNPLTGGLKPTDRMPLSRIVPAFDYSFTLANLMQGLGIKPVTFAQIASLPVTGFAYGMIYVTDGCKVGEGTGDGTGVVCQWSGTDWVTVDAGTVVAN